AIGVIRRREGRGGVTTDGRDDVRADGAGRSRYRHARAVRREVAVRVLQRDADVRRASARRGSRRRRNRHVRRGAIARDRGVRVLRVGTRVTSAVPRVYGEAGVEAVEVTTTEQGHGLRRYRAAGRGSTVDDRERGRTGHLALEGRGDRF